MERRANLSKNVGLSEHEFLTQVFSGMDVSGTGLEGKFAKKASAVEGTRP